MVNFPPEVTCFSAKTFVQYLSSPLFLFLLGSAYRSLGRKTNSRLPYATEKNSCILGIKKIWQIAW